MGKLDRVTWLCGALVLGSALALSCSDKRAPEAAAPTRDGVASAPRKIEKAAPSDERFDAEGRLKSSGRRQSWVELPIGFAEQPGSTPASAVYEADDLPIAKVTEYFEARLAPTKLELRHNGVVYRDAKATHTRLPLSPVHVTVLEIAPERRRIRVVVDDLTPPSEPPLAVDVAARELARERNRIE